MDTETGVQEQPADFANLADGEAYGRYFDLLSSVGEKLMQTYGAEESRGSWEAKQAKIFVAKLLYTIQTLRMKFTYSPAHNRKLWVDLSASGFPNHAEIAKLDTDLLTRPTQLQDIPTESLLKARLLDLLLRKHEDSADLLWQLSERRYLELLDTNAMFMAFTPGELVRQEDNGSMSRSYVYSWGCYDFETNRPYFHVMAFEQDRSEDGLETNPTMMRQFMKVVRAEGSRVPDMQILAACIDDALEWVHPKIVKRICIGPLYAPLIANGDADPVDVEACSLIRRFGNKVRDFVLFFETEIVFSESQKTVRSMWSSKAKVREIFNVPPTDDEAFRRRTSLIHKNILLPHSVVQNMTADDHLLLGVDGRKVLTYDGDERGVHGA